MRIAMLSWESLHSVAAGGVAQHVTELSAALQRAGHEVHVFTRMGPAQFHYERIHGVHYHRCPYPPGADFVDDVNSMCRIFVDRVFAVEDMLGPFDIVHAHDWLASNAMIWIKQGRQRLGFMTIHSTEYGRCGNMFVNGRSHRIRHQERAGTYWADQLIAVSAATRTELCWMYEVPESKVAVVYNGVSPHRFDIEVDAGEAKKEYAIGPLDPTVLFCGRLTAQKGPDILLEAIPSLLNYYPSTKFVFVGDGEMRGPMERRAAQLGISHALRFLGYRQGDELVRIFKLCDAVVVPSRNEPFGIVVLEAWSARKPVVVTQVGGPNEYVWHDVNGLKIFPRPDSVAWGLGTLFTDFERARWMGDNGRHAVEARFTWDHIAQETLEVYRTAAMLPGAPAAASAAAPEPGTEPVAQMPAPAPATHEATEAQTPSLAAEGAAGETPTTTTAIPGGPGAGVAAIPVVAELSVNPMVAGVSRPEVVAALQRLLAAAGLHVEWGENNLKVEGDYDRVMAGIREGHGIVHQMGAALTAFIVVGGTTAAPPIPTAPLAAPPALAPEVSPARAEDAGLAEQASLPAPAAQSPPTAEPATAPALRQFPPLPAQPVRLDALASPPLSAPPPAPPPELPGATATSPTIEVLKPPEPALAVAPAAASNASPAPLAQHARAARRARQRASARGAGPDKSGGEGASGGGSNSKAGDSPTPPHDAGYDSDA
jgi:glycogen synthase